MRKQNRTLEPAERRELIKQLLIARGWLTISEVRDLLTEREGTQFDRKMIDRDFQILSSKSALIDDGGRPRRYSLIGARLERHKVQLTEEHVQTLSLALASLKHYKAMRSLALEAEHALADGLPESLKRMVIDGKDSWVLQHSLAGVRIEHSPKVMRVLLRALREKKCVDCTYQSQTGIAKKRSLAPLKLELSGSGLSLLARDLGREDMPIKRFVPGRFQALKLTSGPVPPATREELAPYLHCFAGLGGPADTPAIVRLIVGREVSKHFEETEYHPSQRFKPLEEGRAEVTFSVPLGWPIVRLIAGFGGQVESMEPPELSRRVSNLWSEGLARLRK